jgi:hypothetical protein
VGEMMDKDLIDKMVILKYLKDKLPNEWETYDVNPLRTDRAYDRVFLLCRTMNDHSRIVCLIAIGDNIEQSAQIALHTTWGVEEQIDEWEK